ncbi:Tudor/PWWP/MBT [Atractiella rhizophila]|nr:Tudor/PWWP/MBT [Atractiella rhizophila]
MSAKKSTKGGDDHKYAVGDVVLAKVKGYPSWPGKLVDPESAPEKVKADKGASSSKFLVKFFPAGDYTWANAKDLSALAKHEIETILNEGSKKKLAANLLEGYRTALNPTKWEKEQEDFLNAQLEAEEELAEDEDQLEEDGDEKGSKKRKRGSTKTVGEKKKKVEKNGKAKKEKSDGGKKKTTKGSKAEAEKGDDDGASKAKTYRNKLQRAFLGKEPPKVEEMDECGKLFTNIEKFDFHRDWLRSSKLGKVMKRISMMEDDKIPKNDKYDFKIRAEKLVKKWQVDVGEKEDNEGDLTMVDGEKKENGDAAEASKMDTSD